jgi:hypothetical protein
LVLHEIMKTMQLGSTITASQSDLLKAINMHAHAGQRNAGQGPHVAATPAVSV